MIFSTSRGSTSLIELVLDLSGPEWKDKLLWAGEKLIESRGSLWLRLDLMFLAARSVLQVDARCPKSEGDEKQLQSGNDGRMIEADIRGSGGTLFCFRLARLRLGSARLEFVQTLLT